MVRRRVLWGIALVLGVALVIYAILFLNRGQTESASPFPERADRITFVDGPRPMTSPGLCPRRPATTAPGGDSA